MEKFRFKHWNWMLYFFVVLFLSGCSELVVFDAKGTIAIEQRNIIIYATLAMLLVVIPVIALTLWYAYKYRASNPQAEKNYKPEFTHSVKLEIVVWAIPILIVSVLGVFAYKGSFALDPYKPLESTEKPVEIQVVALNWKWLFIYPDLNIATINEVAFPKNVPVNFKITADAPMNSFHIPQLAGQVYAMTGMETQLHLNANEAGEYRGASANYSGMGFSGMHFKAIALPNREAFEQWVQQVKTGEKNTAKWFAQLDDSTYNALLVNENMIYEPVQYYGAVKPNIFFQIMNKFAPSGTGHMQNMSPSKPNDKQTMGHDHSPAAQGHKE